MFSLSAYRELLHFAFCRWPRPRAKQRPRMLRHLLVHGGKATLRARHGITPLHLAAWLGLKDELAVLLEYADARHERYLGNPEPKPWAALRFRAQRSFGPMLMRFCHVGVPAIPGDVPQSAPSSLLRGKESVARLLGECGG